MATHLGLVAYSIAAAIIKLSLTDNTKGGVALNVEIVIESGRAEPKLVLYADAMTPELARLVSRLSDNMPEVMIGYIENEAFLLERADIMRIFAQDQKVFAKIGNREYRLKSRIYELEELLAGTSFVRISNSEIANFSKVSSMDMGLSGTITLRFKNGETTYVSRRYVEKIKQYLRL